MLLASSILLVWLRRRSNAALPLGGRTQLQSDHAAHSGA
jgi:hypothetical protein